MTEAKAEMAKMPLVVLAVLFMAVTAASGEVLPDAVVVAGGRGIELETAVSFNTDSPSSEGKQQTAASSSSSEGAKIAGDQSPEFPSQRLINPYVFIEASHHDDDGERSGRYIQVRVIRV